MQLTVDAFRRFQNVVKGFGVYRLPQLGTRGTFLKQMMEDKLIEHTNYIDKRGENMPEIRN